MAAFLGNALILVSFVACVAATWFYFSAARTRSPSLKDNRHQGWGRKAWLISTVAVLGASVALMYLILTHQFQYNYVYSYTSLDLPFFYTFSAFWAGQEGSFLLWGAVQCRHRAGAHLPGRCLRSARDGHYCLLPGLYDLDDPRDRSRPVRTRRFRRLCYWLINTRMHLSCSRPGSYRRMGRG